MPLRLTALSIEGYRSVKRLHLDVGHLTVLVGKNGVGKTNLYRSLELVATAARGTITREIAEEGGVESVLWAGSRAKGKPLRLKLGVDLGDLRYRIEIGLPAPLEAAISRSEPLVKLEELALLSERAPVTLMKREGPSAWLRDSDGKRHVYDRVLLPSETALAAFQDSGQFAELHAVRTALLDWRFFHDFRTDKASPIRRPPLAITTPILSSNGYDLAAALATVLNVRQEAQAIEAAVEDAFPGAALDAVVENGRVLLSLTLADLQRPLAAHELSDGTLSYLCLIAALCSYRLPGFIALNEPEASLHPDLVGPLARLIARASEQTPIWIVTHSEPLAAALEVEGGAVARTVVRSAGATTIAGLKVTGSFADDD